MILGIYDGALVERDWDQDMGDAEAWRMLEACGSDCHHPMHAWQPERGVRHLVWASHHDPRLTHEDDVAPKSGDSR